MEIGSAGVQTRVDQGPDSGFSRLIKVPVEAGVLEGMLEGPAEPRGIVVFAHGSGSSRLSPRNGAVARVLRDAGLGTLLIDLLTVREDQDYDARFDIDLLTRRLDAATEWLRTQAPEGGLPIGYFGASTGAAAALNAAALRRDIGAVVSRGGRPDLASPGRLKEVRAPTLLIVGSLDDLVIRFNKRAFAELDCIRRMELVRGAMHLFEEPGTLEEVAKLSAEWFRRYLVDEPIDL